VWCELTKDIVAIANSGGGIVVFGLDSKGKPTGEGIGQIAATDPADIVNTLAKYIGAPTFEIESVDLKKSSHQLCALLISGASIPHVFQKPGTYDIGGGKQKTAFAVGTVYFRHGAKSEFGNTSDLRSVVERELSAVRRTWIKGVRRVVQAPLDAEIVAIPRERTGTPSPSSVRAVLDPTAQPVLLTRNAQQATATFYHEQISEGIFDEINNVVDANKALSRGQKRFFLGQPIYYRIYAERQHVLQPPQDIGLLAHAAVSELYAPGLFWMLSLPDQAVSDAYAELYRRPRSPQIHSLLRVAMILGNEFSGWLLGRMNDRWKRRTQAPNFYHTFKQTVQNMTSTDYRLLASRLSAKSMTGLPTPGSSNVSELLDNPPRAASLVSMACMVAFQSGDAGESRSIARNLDYLAYGHQIRGRAVGISAAIIQAVDNQPIGDFSDNPSNEEPG
jgi:hypothetical protein